MALFNAPARQPGHAPAAARPALDLQRVAGEVAEAHPGWPRLRVGVNTGNALVGNIGSAELHGYNAMGDAVNVAARLQELTEPDAVVIGESTLRALGDAARVRPLGELTLKGRQQPVHAFVLVGVDPEGAR